MFLLSNFEKINTRNLEHMFNQKKFINKLIMEKTTLGKLHHGMDLTYALLILQIEIFYNSQAQIKERPLCMEL
jgi:hypothetical protein